MLQQKALDILHVLLLLVVSSQVDVGYYFLFFVSDVDPSVFIFEVHDDPNLHIFDETYDQISSVFQQQTI